MSRPRTRLESVERPWAHQRCMRFFSRRERSTGYFHVSWQKRGGKMRRPVRGRDGGEKRESNFRDVWSDNTPPGLNGCSFNSATARDPINRPLPPYLVPRKLSSVCILLPLRFLPPRQFLPLARGQSLVLHPPFVADFDGKTKRFVLRLRLYIIVLHEPVMVYSLGKGDDF